MRLRFQRMDLLVVGWHVVTSTNMPRTYVITVANLIRRFGLWPSTAAFSRSLETVIVRVLM